MHCPLTLLPRAVKIFLLFVSSLAGKIPVKFDVGLELPVLLLDCVDELALLVDELAQLVDELALLVDEPELL
jgi:hypothetical protein